jgi:integrase
VAYAPSPRVRQTSEDLAKSLAGAFVASVGFLVGGALGIAMAFLLLVLLTVLLAYLERRALPPSTVRLDEYGQHLRRRGLTPGTIKSYTLTLNGWFASLDEKRAATKADVDRYFNDRDWSRKTIDLYLTHIRGYYDWAVENGYAPLNPITNADRPRRHGKHVPRPIEARDLERAIDSANDQLRAVLQLAARAGLSAKEIAGLQTRDILLDEPPRLRVAHGKGGTVRVVRLNRKVLEAIRRLDLERTGYLFPGHRGDQSRHYGDPSTHMRSGSISKMVSRHLRELGIDSTCESLRQYFSNAVYTAPDEEATAAAIDRL